MPRHQIEKVSLPKWMEKEEVSGLKKVTCHFWDFCDGDIFIRSIDALEKEWLSLTFHAKKKRLLCLVKDVQLAQL